MIDLIFYRALMLIVPLAIGGTLHMIIVRWDLFPELKIPLHLRLFGPNKTWRGIIMMPLLTAIGTVVAALVEMQLPSAMCVGFFMTPILSGLILGLAYILGELPNSWAKRRLGVRAGMLPEKNRALFLVIDQIDSSIACIIAYRLMFQTSLVILLSALFYSILVGLGLKYLMFLANIRKRPC